MNTGMDEHKMTFEEVLARDGSLVYKNRGDSMLPLIREGRDLLLIERPKEWDQLPEGSLAGKLRRFDVPLYRRDSGQYVLHRVLKVRERDYVLCGDNRYRKEMGIVDGHVIGVLTGIIRDGRELSLKVPGMRYRLYLFFWCRMFPVRAFLLWTKALPGRIVRRMRKARNFGET